MQVRGPFGALTRLRAYRSATYVAQSHRALVEQDGEAPVTASTTPMVAVFQPQWPTGAALVVGIPTRYAWICRVVAGMGRYSSRNGDGARRNRRKADGSYRT